MSTVTPVDAPAVNVSRVTAPSVLVCSTYPVVPNRTEKLSMGVSPKVVIAAGVPVLPVVVVAVAISHDPDGFRKTNRYTFGFDGDWFGARRNVRVVRADLKLSRSRSI